MTGYGVFNVQTFTGDGYKLLTSANLGDHSNIDSVVVVARAIQGTCKNTRLDKS